MFAAGAVGTTGLLLRLREAGDLPRLSERVGELFRTNSEYVPAVRLPVGTGPEVAHRVSITSDVGTVTLSGDTALPANGTLVVGAPDGQITALESVETADAAEATVALSKPITNGLTYNFTFTFEKSGEGTFAVPISAGESPRREEAGAAGHSGGGGGH